MSVLEEGIYKANVLISLHICKKPKYKEKPNHQAPKAGELWSLGKHFAHLLAEEGTSVRAEKVLLSFKNNLPLLKAECPSPWQ